MFRVLDLTNGCYIPDFNSGLGFKSQKEAENQLELHVACSQWPTIIADKIYIFEHRIKEQFLVVNTENSADYV